jgi:hypothetical protein
MRKLGIQYMADIIGYLMERTIVIIIRVEEEFSLQKIRIVIDILRQFWVII